jgi:hypothetical protein
MRERIRVYKSFFKTAQDDPSMVYSVPYLIFEEFPFLWSFKLKEGMLEPS